MPRTHRLSAAAAVAVAVLLVGGPGRAAAQSRHSEAGAASAATPAAAGTAHTISDRNRKENFRPVDGEALLRYLRDIPVTSWNYIGHDDSVRHIGPMAQDWERVFGLSGDTTTISTVDMAGITFAGVQALEIRSAGHAARVEMLEQRLRELERRLAEKEVLTHRIQQLERTLESLAGKKGAAKP